jgi:hypothetical protein
MHVHGPTYFAHSGLKPLRLRLSASAPQLWPSPELQVYQPTATWLVVCYACPFDARLLRDCLVIGTMIFTGNDAVFKYLITNECSLSYHELKGSIQLSA